MALTRNAKSSGGDTNLCTAAHELVQRFSARQTARTEHDTLTRRAREADRDRVIGARLVKELQQPSNEVLIVNARKYQRHCTENIGARPDRIELATAAAQRFTYRGIEHAVTVGDLPW